MQSFSQLISRIDQSTKTNEKLKALVSFFEEAEDSDKIWAIALFTHRRPKGLVKTAELRQWASEMAGVPQWLFEESYHIVGDLAETISSILPQKQKESDNNLTGWINYLVDLKSKEEGEKKQKVFEAWACMDKMERFIFNKLMTGGFRIGVSQRMMAKALAKYAGKEESEIAHRLMGNWDPFSISFEELILAENKGDDLSKPYPFYLAYALEDKVEELGDLNDWQVEWKWDGIRGQLIKRGDEVYIWSRGEELMTDKFPELAMVNTYTDKNFVIDGEIICFNDEQILPFNVLQTRIGRKKLSKKILQEAPIGLIAYDIMEMDGEDVRDSSMTERRQMLEKVIKDIGSDRFRISEIIEEKDWKSVSKLREQSRLHHAEGFMLKKKDSVYKSGRKRGDWWKWKIDPLTIDAIMIYAMRGHGRRANLYTDFTFAVRDGENLVPFAKAYSGLTDEEFVEVNKFIQKNTIERFGPVRSVVAELVFEIAFEGIAKSTRHKSGVALRFPRISRWRKDKKPVDSNTLDDLYKMLEMYGN